jgi:hypothetical protein
VVGPEPAPAILARVAPVDAVEQCCSGDPERLRQLGDGSDARLTLAALDLRDVSHVEIGVVRQTFLVGDKDV